MPLYDFQCADGHRFERHVPLDRFEERQACDCGCLAHRMIAAPRVVSDYLVPTWGPDGKQHESKSSYYASLEPGGNPKGEKYYILGEGEQAKSVIHESTKAERIEVAKRVVSEAGL